MSTTTLNRDWAMVILTALSRHNVTDVCIAPGSRSTPLTLEATANAHFNCHTHFDERGLAFLALGLAKSSNKPVVVIVTSGTAVANLYPALIEAGLTGERIILLTADRPPELIDCGANQAIRQEAIFASHPAFTLHLPRPTTDISARWLVSTIDNAMYQAEFGSLHINCPFAEPLYGDKSDEYTPWVNELGEWWRNEKQWLTYSNDKQVCPQLDWPVWQKKKGVIIAGSLSAKEGVILALWADKIGWPLLADVQSSTGQPLPYADLWLNHPQAKKLLSQAEFAIQFGAQLTGKRLLQWQANCQLQEFWLVDERPVRLDPANHYGRRIVANIEQWLLSHPVDNYHHWASQLPTLSMQCELLIHSQISHSLSEAKVANHLPMLLPQDGQLFVGNSLIVRLIDALAQLPTGYPVFSNRGASGIDGLIATSIGVAKANKKPTMVIMGDISALYDLNSLALLSERWDAAYILFIVNNNGGSIFSLLPTPADVRERFYRMPHGLTFKHAAKMFNIKYVCPDDWQQLQTIVSQTWQKREPLIIELTVLEHEGAELLRDLVEQVAQLSC